MHGLNHAVVRQPTFLPSNSGGKVFLCPLPDVNREPSTVTSENLPHITACGLRITGHGSRMASV